jgi:hypothetical protein
MNFRVHKVTGITVILLVIVAAVFLGVVFAPTCANNGPLGYCFTADQKTMVITGVIAIAGACTGYWLNSSADKQPPEPPPRL